MPKKIFVTAYTVFSFCFLIFAATNYFGFAKNLWWFAAMLSGLISSSYGYFWLRGKVTEESFVNFIVTIFLITSFLISFGLSVYQGGQENLPIILAGSNLLIWIFYCIYYSKKTKTKG